MSQDFKPQGGNDSNMQGGNDSNMQEGNDSNMQGGNDSNMQEGNDSNMQEGNDSNMQGGNDSNMQEGNDSNMQGGNDSNMQEGNLSDESQSSQPRPDVSAMLVLTSLSVFFPLFTTILCVPFGILSFPVGVVSIVFAIRSFLLRDAGAYQDAIKTGNVAKILAWVSLGICAVGIIAGGILFILNIFFNVAMLQSIEPEY